MILWNLSEQTSMTGLARSPSRTKDYVAEKTNKCLDSSLGIVNSENDIACRVESWIVFNKQELADAQKNQLLCKLEGDHSFSMKTKFSKN